MRNLSDIMQQGGEEEDRAFWSQIKTLPEQVRGIQGILNLNPIELSNKYLEKDTVAEASIDPNANIQSKSPVNFTSEIFKPQQKLRGYYEIWRRLYHKYGSVHSEDALNSMLNGTLYFHDITKIDMPYCYAFDTSFIMFEGRPYNGLPGGVPKRSSSFIGQVVETTMDFSQQLAGAVGIPNILVNLAYYTHKERQEMHRIADKFSNIYDAIYGVSMFVAGLGYTGEHFTVGTDLDTVEDRIGKYWYSHSGAGIHDLVDMAYDKYAEDLIQQFVHVMHNTFRVGGDSPFTNISIFDKHFIHSFLKDARYPDLSAVPDNAEEIMRIQKVFVNFFVVGSKITGKKYKFPVGTVNIKKWSTKDVTEGWCSEGEIGKIADSEFFSWIMAKNLKRGTFNIHIGEKVATCCRLSQDLADLKATIRQDTFGNGGISIGSHRVVLINLRRVALNSVKLYQRAINAGVTVELSSIFYENLKKYLVQVRNILIVHKELLKDRVESGFLQFFNIHWSDLTQFFSTIGYTGLWDAFQVLYPQQTGKGFDKDFYIQVAGNILDFIEDFAKKSGKENNGYAFNVEEVPGENACVKLAELDNYYYKEIKWYKPISLLSNQMVPLWENVNLFDRLYISGKLMNKVSGGSILHLNLNEDMTEQCNEDINRLVIEKYDIPHYAINRGSTTCVDGHTTVGISWKCPICDKDIYTHTLRIVGYESDTVCWSPERQEEFKNRIFYTAQDMLDLLPQ